MTCWWAEISWHAGEQRYSWHAGEQRFHALFCCYSGCRRRGGRQGDEWTRWHSHADWHKNYTQRPLWHTQEAWGRRTLPHPSRRQENVMVYVPVGFLFIDCAKPLLVYCYNLNWHSDSTWQWKCRFLYDHHSCASSVLSILFMIMFHCDITCAINQMLKTNFLIYVSPLSLIWGWTDHFHCVGYAIAI